MIASSSLSFALEWKPFGKLLTPRKNFQIEMINDSLILVMGGADNNGKPLSSCEIINVKTRKVTSVPPMSCPRLWFNSHLTNDSNVIVFGGHFASLDIEKFNRTTFTWEIIGKLTQFRAQLSSCFFDKDKILIVGGINPMLVSLDSCEIFDINTGITKMTQNYFMPSNGQVTFLSKNNNIVSFGGRAGETNALRSSNIYSFNPTIEKWSLSGKLNRETYLPSSLKLPDSTHIIVGGSFIDEPEDFSNKMYFEDNGSVVLKGDMLKERILHQLAQWNEDSVVVVGGKDDGNRNVRPCEWINIRNFQTEAAPDLIEPRRYIKVMSFKRDTIYKNRSVLAIAGADDSEVALSSIEILESDEIIVKPNPPKITSSSFYCGKFYYTIEDDYNINQVVLESSKSDNCKIEIIDKLPGKKIRIIVSLIDPYKDGFFLISNKSDKYGMGVNIENKINAVGYVSSIELADTTDSDGFIDFGKFVYGSILKKSIKFMNVSSKIFSINNVEFNNNVSFSVPLAQLPFEMQPGETKPFDLWINVNQIGEFLDSIKIIIDSCNSFDISVKALGFKEDFNAKDRCTQGFLLNTIAIEGRTPFIESFSPNPAFNFIEINFGGNIQNSNSEIKILNSIGEEVEQFNLRHNRKLKIDLTDFPAGVYFIKFGMNFEKFIKL